MHGAEDMIVDHNMVVTQVFRGLGKRLDRPCIAAEFDLRINHTSFHRRLPFHDLRSCARYTPFASGPEAAARTLTLDLWSRAGRRLPGAMTQPPACAMRGPPK